jgi:hypothetical protein
MDPYLESPDWFPGFHDSLIVFMKGKLQQSLPESYYAESSQRVWLEYTHRHVEPDVEIAHSAPTGRKQGRGAELSLLPESQDAGPLVVTVETIEHGPFKETYLDIRRRHGRKVRLVTSIEVLSPSNKMKGNPGRAKFQEKQRETLESETHVVEIDLIRGGTHMLAVPRNLVLAEAGRFDYLVSIRRFNRRKEFLIHPIILPQRLPQITIPLLPGDPDVPLDLQDVFDQAYEIGPYRREIVYGKDPIVPRLSPEQAQWARTLLARRGRRA